jgi:hypothetical protein
MGRDCGGGELKVSCPGPPFSSLWHWRRGPPAITGWAPPIKAHQGVGPDLWIGLGDQLQHPSLFAFLRPSIARTLGLSVSAVVPLLCRRLNLGHGCGFNLFTTRDGSPSCRLPRMRGDSSSQREGARSKREVSTHRGPFFQMSQGHKSPYENTQPPSTLAAGPIRCEAYSMTFV